MGPRSHPAVLLRRLERPAHAGYAGRGFVQAARHVPSGAHGVRGADGDRGTGDVRKDAVRHLPGLPGRAAHHSLGRQPFDLGHSPRTVRPAGAEAGRPAHRHRSACDAARASGRSPHRAQAGDRRRHRALDASVSLRGRARRHRVHRGAHQGRRAAPQSRRGMDDRSRGRNIGRPGGRAPPVGSGLREHVASAGALRVGTRAQSQRRKRGDGDSRVAVGGRQVRRARRRLLDEQFQRLEYHQALAGSRTGHARREHEQARTRADGTLRSTYQGDVRVQRQPGRDPARSAARAPGHGPRRSLHRRLRSGDDRHGGIRRRHPAGHDVSRSVRFRERVRAAEPAAREAGHRHRGRIAIESRGLRRARETPGRARIRRDRQRARHAAPGVPGAAGRCRHADRRHGPGRSSVWIAPRSVRRRHAEDVRRQS